MSYKDLEAFAERLDQSIHDTSVRSFSRKCGVSETALRAYLAGKSDPSRRALVAMAKTAGVSVSWLATGNGIMHPGDCGPESNVTQENQLLREEQRQAQQEKFKKGLQLVFDMSKSDPDCNPEGVWSALLIELLAMHGLQESGYQRIQETLKKLKERDENKHRNS